MVVLNQTLYSAFSGIASGAATAIAIAPLDVVKTRMHIQGKLPLDQRRYTTTIGSLRTIIKEEGALSLYSGLKANLVGMPVSWGVYYTVYERVKKLMKLSDTRIIDFDGKMKWGKFVRVSACAVTAGFAASLSVQPIFVIRTRMQSHILTGANTAGAAVSPSYNSMFKSIFTILRAEGWSGLYRSVLPSLFGLTHVMVQFPVYELCKFHYARYCKGKVSPFGIAVCSAVSKIVASTAAYPHEVIRSRMQMGEVGMFNVMGSIYRSDGLVGFYRGLGTTLLRAVPSCITTFSVYELCNRIYDNQRAKQMEEDAKIKVAKSI